MEETGIGKSRDFHIIYITFDIIVYCFFVHRSSKFFLTIEEAVVKGGKVLIEHFPSPMDPALLPVIEIGNSKEGKYYYYNIMIIYKIGR